MTEIIHILQSFTQKFKKEHPDLYDDIDQQLQENCNLLFSEEAELFPVQKLQHFTFGDVIIGVQNETDSPLNSTYIALACAFRVIDNVTAAYDLEREWIEYRQAAQPYMERLRDCTDEK